MKRNLLRLPLYLSIATAACQKPVAEVEDESSVTIASFIPEGVTGTQPIEIRFSKDVVKPDLVGKKKVAGNYLELEPAIPGSYEWREPSLLAYIPSEPFRPSTRYTAKVRDETTGRLRLIGNREFKFNTELFQLRTVTPFFEGIAPAIRVRANLEFSHPVEPGEIRSAVTFTDATGRVLPATLRSAKTDAVMSFEIERALSAEEAKAITITVGGNVRALAGGEPLGKEVTRTVNYAPLGALELQDIYVQQQDGAPSLYVRFNADVDHELVHQAIDIEPPVETRPAAQYFGVSLVGGFEPGKTYQITIKSGIASRQGGLLGSSVTRAVMIPDLEPEVRFSGQGSYLLKSGKQSFSVESVNIEKLKISVDKVFENNILHVLPRLRGGSSYSSCEDGCDYYEEYYDEGYYGSQDLSSYGVNLLQGEIQVATKRNTRITTAVPFQEIDSDKRQGLYRVRISDGERGWVYAERWLLATDLGLTAKVGAREARVQVVSIANLGPVAGVEVSFISRTNQLIGRSTTNAEGIAVQSLSGLSPEEPLALVTARRGSDFSYLSLANTAIPTADFDVGGEGDTTSPYEAYVYADRGVYRPGDKAHLTVIVRDATLGTPPAFPYRVEIRNPRWQLFETLRGNTQLDGAQSYTVNIPEDALTGDYNSSVLSADGATVLGRLRLKVEDFMPDRIKVELEPDSRRVDLPAPVNFKVKSAYLFGAKAAGLQYEASCRFDEVAVSGAKFSGFAFGADDGLGGRRAIGTTEEIGEGELDEEGETTVSCALAGGLVPRRPVRATALVTVSERGGRAVGGSSSATLHAHPFYLGVRRNSNESYAERGKDAELEVMAVDQDGEARKGVAVDATFYSVEWKTILRFVNNRYQYVSERSEKKIGSAKLTTDERPVKLPFAPENTGQFRVELVAGPTQSTTSQTFWVSGGGYAAWQMSKPDQIGLTLDKSEYAAGETARVMVRAPFSGKLYLTVERDRVLTSRVVDLEGNSGTVMIPVTGNMTPNAYVVAQLIRAPNSKEKQAPMRAFGVIPLSVKSDQHRLKVEVQIPEEMRPKQPLEVKVKVEGHRGPARFTVAAVDEGILRITNHSSPDPYAFFLRKKRLGLRTHDMFELLLPEVRQRATSILRGSGGDEETRKKHLSPVSVKRVKPVALWSGIVDLAPDGTGTVRFDVPEFQGALRVMVVAFEQERFGAAAGLVKVKDPIVLTPTLPRFFGPLDKVEMPVEVYNGTQKEATIEVETSIQGRIQVVGNRSQKLKLPANGQGLVRFQLLADEVVGKATVTVVGRAGGLETQSTTDVAIRPPNTVTTEGAAFSASWNNEGKFSIPGGFMEGTQKTTITVGPAPVTQFGAALQYLLRYPYGCVEQTTSKAFPLLYFKELARHSAPELAEDSASDHYVNSAISRLGSMLSRQGGLSYWPGVDYGYAWSTIYGAHFLVEAKKAGYTVDQGLIDTLVSHLNLVASGLTVPFYGSNATSLRERAYALYVLALAGRPNRSAALAVAEQTFSPKRTGPRPDGETRALAAGALLLGGDAGRASSFVNEDVSFADAGPQSGFWSATREDALMLSVLADVAPRHKSVIPLMQNLVKRATVGRWYNTQENAYALMALGKIGKVLGQDPYWGTVYVGGQETKRFSNERPLTVRLDGSEAVGKEVKITITGKGTAFVGIQVEGIKAGVLPAKSSGLEVSRKYYDPNGQPVSPDAINQGDLLAVELVVSPVGGARVENVAIVDLLPAGLEIENPRLSGDSVFDWMKDRSVPDYVDIRDDRIIMFATLETTRTFYYTARAVTKGEFVLPHVHAEAMYDPATQGYSGGGKLTVK